MTSGLFIGLYRNQQDGQAGVDFSGRGKNILFVIAKPDVHKAFVPSCRARGFGGRVWDPGFWRRMFWAWKRGGGGGGGRVYQQPPQSLLPAIKNCAPNMVQHECSVSLRAAAVIAPDAQNRFLSCLSTRRNLTRKHRTT